MDILKHLSCNVLSTVTQEADEKTWLQNRSKGIGGSDIGAICGVNKYSTPRLVYLKKTGQYEEPLKTDNAAKDRMRFGHLLEPIIAEEYAIRSGKKIAVSPATLVHRDYPWALANVDRFIVDDEGKPYGILEVKTAGEFMNDMWDEGELPLYNIYQLNWYLWICNLEFGAFACLVGGNKFYYYEVYRNDELIAEMLEKGDKFWNYHVKELVEPPLTSNDTEFVNGKFSDVVKNSEIVLDNAIANDLAKKVKEIKASVKELEKQQDAAANALKEMMANNEIAYTADYIIKWSPRSQQRVDSDKLKTMYPEVYTNCLKKISFRAFSVK